MSQPFPNLAKMFDKRFYWSPINVSDSDIPDQCNPLASFTNKMVAISYLACHPHWRQVVYTILCSYYHGCTVLTGKQAMSSKNPPSCHDHTPCRPLPFPFPCGTSVDPFPKVLLGGWTTYHRVSNKKPIISSTLRSKHTKQGN